MTERPVFFATPDGVREVLQRARHRRRRRIALTATGAAVIAAVGGVLAIVPSAGVDGADRLKVVPASPSPQPSRVLADKPRPLLSPSPADATAQDSAPGRPAPGTATTPFGPQPPADSPTPTAPTTRKSASAPITRTTVGYDSACDATNDIVGWCVVYTGPDTARRKHPVRLSMELCRPQVNGDGTIHFDDTRQIDLELFAPDGSTVWRAGQGIGYRSPGPDVVVRAGTCLRWVSTWDTIAPDGFYAPPGTYPVSYAIDSSDVGGSFGGPSLELTD